MPLVFVVMGVSGCGKSTVGALLARRLGCPFYEGDSLHAAASVAKMRAGTPLSDDDRWPWLRRLADIVARHLAAGQPAVLSCSALKPAYRCLLRGGAGGDGGGAPASCGGDGGELAFVLLDPPRAWLERRLEARAAAGAHFMPAALLDSQLAALSYEEAELFVHLTGGGGAGAEGEGGGGDDGFPSPEQAVAAILRRLQAPAGPGLLP